MYKIIDENENKNKTIKSAEDINFNDLGLKETNDFAEFATETIKSEMPDKFNDWKKKGSIGVFEAGRMFADEFDGTYDNVLSVEEQKRRFEMTHPVIGESRSNKVDERIAKNKRVKEERQKRINNGTASIYDKIVNKFDQFGDDSYKAQVEYAKQNEQLQKSNKDNPNYRYEANGSLSGRVVYNEIDLRKKIGFVEGLRDSISSGQALPFVAGLVSGSQNDAIEKIKNKINNGEEITQQELDRFNKHIERAYEKQVRGYSIGGQIGESWLPSMMAFGSEMFLAGAILKGVGLTGKGLSIGSNLTKTLGGGKAAKITGDITGHLLEGGVAAGVTSAVNPARLYATYKERRLNDTMKITDRGTVIFTDAKESPAKAFFKSLQQVYISYFTENMGGIIGMPVKGVLSTGAKQFAKVLEHNPMLKKVIQKTSPVFEKLNKDFLKSESAQWLKSQVKFDGFLEELGEEVLEDVLNLTFNTNYEERSLENYVNAIFKSPEEWAVLTGTIALQGTTLSLSGNLLADTMQRNGTGFEEIKNVIDTSTEDEKAEIIDSLKDAGFLKINPDAIDVKLSDSLKEERKQKFIKDGMSESNADFSASIENDMLNRISQKTGIDIDEIYSKEAPTIHTNDYELSVDDNGNRYIDDEISQEDLDYYQDLAEREEYNQVETAGVETPDEVSDAINEWQEKGTESKYFKKWFGDSKVVDENGKPKRLTDDKDIYIVDGYSNNGISRYSYKGSHRAPSYADGDVQERLENSEDVNLFEVAQGYHNQPDDYFSPMGARYYMYDDKEGLESARAVKDVIAKIKNGKENITVKIYRAVPADVVSNKLKNGDWVTLSKSYAIEHGEQNLDGEYKIIENEVPINEVWWDGNDLREWGYDNGKEQEADLYLKIENPKYQDVLPANWKEARELRNQGYDGVITTDGKYLGFEKTQIKSVDNRGTFDENNPNIYYQSAYHGSPHKFEKFSTDFMGKGEGNQAHGWGVYLAGDKNVSEGYRKNLTMSIPDIVEYDGKEIKDNSAKVMPIKIEKDSVPNFKKVSDLKKWIGDNLNLLGDVQIKNNSRTVHFSKSNIGRSMKGINRSSTKRNSYAGLKELVENSVYSYTKEVDKRHSKRNNGQEIYHNAFIYNGEVYGIEISIDIPKNTNTTHSYAGHKIEIIKKAPEVNGTKLPDLTGANISINDIRKLFNPTTYEQEIQPSLFEGNNKAREIHKVKGSFMPAEKIIELFKNADISTIIHEYAHWYLSVMERYASVSAEVEEDLNEVRKFVKNSGEEFTQEQHEKFARGFEAYIRSGNARSNRLKKIYEDLKNALLQIYDEITKIVYTENGIDKPFTEEDLPQIKGLFDRLLSTENERIQRTVFDKVDEIDEQIKKIKENQAKEEQELDELYKGNIAAINRKSDKQRKVSEYLDLAEKATKRVPKAMREFKKRYRDVTLAILSMASGKNRRWVADRRNWDKLYDILENVSDEIVANGADPAWSEFYALQGSTYDTEEIGADYKLAMQAYNNLVADNYSYSSYFNDPTIDKDIEDFYSKLNYIVEKVKILKGEEKEVAFDALAELTNSIPQMPDELMLEVAQIIESTFEKKEEQQKEDFNRKSYPNIPVVQQLQMYVTRKLSNLKVYDADKRYATRLDRSHNLYKSIKNATSVNKTKKIIRKINNYVIEDLRNKQRRILHKEIQKQVKINSKLVKTGSVQKGKFDWRTNTVFAELADMNKLSREDAEKMYLTLIKADDALLGEERENWSDNIVESMNIDKTDFQQLLKVKFLEYRSQYISKLDVLHTRSVLEDIMALKFEGRRAKSEEDLKKKLNKYDYENNLIDILQKHKDNKIAKTLAKWIMHSQTLSNWESLLNGIFDANTAEKYSLQQMEVSTDVYAREHFLSFLKRASEIYGFKKASAIEKALDFDNIQPLADLFRKYDNELYDYKETTFNKETGKYVETQRKLSKSQIMTIFTWSLNEELEQRLYTQFGLEQISDMFSRLSDEDMQLCFALIDCCDSMYEDTNEVFIRTLGISLPKVENYFPSKTERVGSDLDLFHDFMMKSSNPSFIKQRKSCNRIKMDPQSPLEILLPHINKTAKYVVMSEQLNFYNKIFASADVKAKIRDVFGEKDGDKLHRALLNQLAASTFSTYARGSAMTSDLLEHFNISTNYITSAIGGSGKVTIGQLLSVINYAENMPSGEWAKGFAKACANPVKTYKYMMDNCKYLQSRLAGNSQNEILQTLTSLKDPFRKLKNFCTLNVRWGDIIAITIGGKPYVDYLISTGMTKEEAFDKFVDDTLRAQQAGLNSTTSEWQKNNAKNFLGRMFFAFRNTDIQYERKFIDSIIKASKGDITKKQLVKTIMIYKVLNPVMFTSFLQNMSLVYLFNALFGFGDGGDDKEKAVGKTVMDIIMALGVAGTNAYGMGGFCVNAIIQAIYAGINRLIFDDSDYKIFGSSVPVLSDFEKIGKDIFAKGEVGFDDVLDAFCVGADLTTGAPVKKVKNMTLGVGDVARGEFGIGFSRMLGWGEYVSTKAWTGKAPKKKKKKRKLNY